MYEVKFERLTSEISMEDVLRRPYSDEIEDYKEYKRLRDVFRDQQQDVTRPRVHAVAPTLTLTTDGAGDSLHTDDVLASMIGDGTDHLPDGVEHAQLVRGSMDFARSDSRVQL